MSKSICLYVIFLCLQGHLQVELLILCAGIVCSSPNWQYNNNVMLFFGGRAQKRMDGQYVLGSKISIKQKDKANTVKNQGTFIRRDNVELPWKATLNH